MVAWHGEANVGGRVREAEHAPKALQSLTLTGAACKDAFGAQQRSLANIIELIYKQLCLPPPCGRDAHADIVLKRRVFTKVCRCTSPWSGSRGLRLIYNYAQVRPTTQLSSSLTKQDDPTGRAAKIAHQWCAEHHVVVGVQKEDGTIARANPMVIRRGDFVDVAVTLHIVTMRARKVRKTEVFFSPQEVVRLAPAANAAVRSSSARRTYHSRSVVASSESPARCRETRGDS